jgi:GT2 family glycosyltransferase
MKEESCVILVSNCPKRIELCLQYIVGQTLQFDRVLLVAWGQEETKRQVINKAQDIYKKVEIIDPDGDTRLENNRNKAISYLISNQPRWVTFLDDDTFIDKNWHAKMISSAGYCGDEFSFASLTRHLSNNLKIQSAGHIFNNTKPLDLAYDEYYENFIIDKDPFCPCGNSAFVPWNGIKRIMEIDMQVWDPDFDQWQTCFDFGMKLFLVHTKCKLVKDACAFHDGYLDNSLKGLLLNQNQVKKQLRSRFLLYGKFLPDNEQAIAQRVLNDTLCNKWLSKGYPHAEKHLKGNLLQEIYDESYSEANAILELKKPFKWKEIASGFDPQIIQKHLLRIE